MPTKRGKVLCVDDEPNIVRSLQWLLQKDFDVLTANNGQHALALVQQHDFDVVISDQRMPVMTGVELLREVRRLSPRSMRILLTGYSDMQAMLRSINESEVFRFVNKPWNIAELPSLVAEAVDIAKSLPAHSQIDDAGEDHPIAANDDRILVIDDDPETQRAVLQVVGDAVRVSYTGNLAEAVGILNSEPVSVIVSDTRVGSIDATRLVRLMKSRHPDIVTVMLSGEADAEAVTALINQGQIYRFIPKPVRPGYLRQVLDSALRKHDALSLNPQLAGRHAVEATPTQVAESLVSDVHKIAGEVEASAAGAKTGFLSSISSGLRRLFGG